MSRSRFNIDPSILSAARLLRRKPGSSRNPRRIRSSASGESDRRPDSPGLCIGCTTCKLHVIGSVAAVSQTDCGDVRDREPASYRPGSLVRRRLQEASGLAPAANPSPQPGDRGASSLATGEEANCAKCSRRLLRFPLAQLKIANVRRGREARVASRRGRPGTEDQTRSSTLCRVAESSSELTV